MTDRKCGACTLCCKLTPVREVNKPGGTRCQHQRMGKGCSIYAKRPLSCRLWNCRWLAEDDTHDQRRPDLSHVVIDVMPDFVTMQENVTGRRREIPVIQVWVDPRHRDAWKATEIISFFERRSADGFGAIIRYSETDATVIFPPVLAQKLTGQAGWIVHETGLGEATHDQDTIAEVMTRVTGEAYAVGAPARAQAALGKLFAGDKP